MNIKLAMLASIGLAFFVLPSCKKAEKTSGTKTLDNFTSSGKVEDFTWNDCKGTEKVTVPHTQLLGNSTEKDAIREALSALPVEMQDAFFKSMNGKIAIVSDINTSCKVPPSSAGIDATLSCWQLGTNNVQIFIKAETAPVQSGTTMLSAQEATVRNIKHSVVRSFAFVLTDIIMQTPATAGSMPTESKGSIQLRKEIGDILVTDLKALKMNVPPLYKSDRDVFEKAAFAESFDSWYCSATSRSNMEKFKKSHSYFAMVAQDLPKVLRGEYYGAAQSDPAVGAQLLGMQNNGCVPLQQGSQSWAEFRNSGGGLFNYNRAASGGGYIFRRPWFNPFRWG